MNNIGRHLLPLLISVLACVTGGFQAVRAENRIGLEYYLMVPQDDTLQELFDNPKLHHAFLEGDFEITPGLDLRFGAGWTQLSANTEFGALGKGNITYMQVPIEVGARFNFLSGKYFSQFLAVGPGVYILQFRNKDAATTVNRADAVGWGGWISSGIDAHITEIIGITLQLQYVFSQAEIQEINKRVDNGGLGVKAGLLLFF